MTNCPLCIPDNEQVLWKDEVLRIILVNDPDYPAFCRVILNRHVQEMTDLPAEERTRLMQAVYAVEATLREQIQPDKINLASLGNQVPHLHWHVIPRFANDRHFPDPVWAPARRQGRPHQIDTDRLVESIRVRLAIA